jgi:hypothetical protein
MNRIVLRYSRWLLAIGLLAVLAAPINAQPLTGWLYRAPISITNSGSASNYFALVTINTATPISQGKMAANGSDLRITDGDCSTQLSYWIQSGINTSSTKIWVKIPSMSGNKTLYLYYGKPGGASAVSSLTSVFGSNISALYTFTEGSGSTVKDQTGNGFDLTVQSLTWGSSFRNGVWALSGYSSGGRSYYNGNGPAIGTGAFTAITFMNPTSATGSTQGIIGNYNNDGANGWVLKEQGGAGQMMVLTNQGGSWCQVSRGSLVTNSWNMVGCKRDNSTTYMYQNSINQGSICTGDNRNLDNNGPFELGRSYNGNYALNGSMSFSVVFSTGLSDADVASFTSSVNPGFDPTYAVGAEETIATAQITQHPQDAYRCTGTSVTFTVGVSGVAASYQWQKNQVNIPGATGPTYTIGSVALTDGGKYRAVVSATCSAPANSNEATLIVEAGPGITQQPASYILCPGNPASFSVNATGATQYQWFHDGMLIPGANTNTYMVPSAQMSDTGSYWVKVDGQCTISVISQKGHLSLLEPLQFISESIAPITNLCRLSPLEFSVDASGTGLAIQWRKNGQPIVGATGKTLYIAGNPLDAGTYDAMITGTCSQGPIFTSQGTVMIRLDPLILSQPQTVAKNIGDPVTFTVEVMGELPFTFQWQKDGLNIPGARAQSYSIASITIKDMGEYNCVIGNGCTPPMAVTNEAWLQIKGAASIIAPPSSQVICAGGSATFRIGTTGENLNFQWRKDNVPVPGADSPTLKITNATASDAGNYDCIVRAQGDTAITSDAASLTVNPALSVLTQPTAHTVCVGSSASFTVDAVGGSVTYQWRRNGTDIPGATNATYAISSADMANAGRYDCRINGACGDEKLSNSAELAINTPPEITLQPASQNVASGERLKLSVEATGTNLSYQWRHNGRAISGATAPEYVIDAATSASSGVYDVTVNGLCAPTSSMVAIITVDGQVSSVDLADAATGAMMVVMPNPAHGLSRMTVNLPKGIQATAGSSLALYDATGKLVADLSESYAATGFTGASFDASLLPSGIYYCRLTTKSFNGTLGTVVIEK